MCPIDPFLFRVQIYYIATRVFLKKEIRTTSNSWRRCTLAESYLIYSIHSAVNSPINVVLIVFCIHAANHMGL
nr:hypothetical protein Q903MT_gene5177 [Picea sitchensis]